MSDNTTNICLPCGHSFESKYIKHMIYNVAKEKKICPTCMKQIPHLLNDVYRYQLNGTPEKYLDLPTDDDWFKFKKCIDHENTFTIDGYTYSNTFEQLHDNIGVDAVTITYSDVSDMTAETLSMSRLQNSQKTLGIYAIRSDEDPEHFILIDDYAKYLLMTTKISGNEIEKTEDNLGHVYYTTYTEFPLRKYIGTLNTTLGLALATYGQSFNLPYINMEFINKYIDESARDPNDIVVLNGDRVISGISNLLLFSLLEYIERDIQLNLSVEDIMMIFTIASISNIFKAIGHTEFKVLENFIRIGLSQQPITVEITDDMVKQIYDQVFGDKKYEITDPMFVQMMRIDDELKPILDQMIEEQQKYIDHFVEINIPDVETN